MSDPQGFTEAEMEYLQHNKGFLGIAEEVLFGDHPEEAKKDNIVLPYHYARFKFEPLRVDVENYGHGILIHKINKYINRADAKNGMEDLHKARRCLDMLIEFIGGNPWWWTKDFKEPSNG